MKNHLLVITILAMIVFGTSACDQSVSPQDVTASYQLVFLGSGQHVHQGIYALDPRGTSIQRLTPDSMYVAPHFSCSPDGQSILFGVYVNQSSDIWKIMRSNRALTRVVADPAFDGSPYWLYDGSGFAFQSSRTGRFSAWICDANGANQRQMVADTASTSLPIASPKRPLVAISFSSKTLVVLDYQRNLQIPVTPDSMQTNSNFFAWSASGDKLAFEVLHDLYTWDLSGDLQRCWTESDYIFNPAWSPDGKKIAFNVQDTLRILDVSGQTPRSLMSGMAFGGRSSWSPDGKFIAVEVQNPPSIVIIAADGSSSMRVPIGDNTATTPQWINAVW